MLCNLLFWTNVFVALLNCLTFLQEMGMGGKVFDRQQAQRFAENAKEEGNRTFLSSTLDF